VAALGGFLFGFDTAVISGTEGTLRQLFAERYGFLSETLRVGSADFWHGFTVATALIGTVIGAMSAGRPADQLGRRAVLFVLGVFYLVSALGSALAWDWASLVIFRFLGGLAVGGASVVSPMYIAEISPARYRGRLVAVNQFNVVTGILAAYFSNYWISGLNLGNVEWRWMFGVEAFPAGVFVLLLFLNPRSPRWLVSRGYLDEAGAVLETMGTDTGSVEEEIREIQTSLDFEHHSLREPFFCRKYAQPIMLAAAIAAFNQLSGINALIYYTKHIFEMAGAGSQSALFQSVIVGFTNLVFTMGALLIIDHFGRRKLMLVGSLGYIFSLGATAWAFYTDTGGVVVLAGLLVFIASHASGQGAVMLVFISEIFPNRVRARGQALGCFTHWFMAAVISWTFPIIAASSGGHAFAFYSICMVAQLIWVLWRMPETKGITLEQIQKQFDID
jgi:sugar porter (SP) family MFS transporter